MGVRSSSKSGLFLLELMFAILFFAIASGICIQMFAKAHTISKQSVDYTMASQQAQSVAEAYKACDGSFSEMAHLLGGGYSNGRFVMEYGKDWVHVDSSAKASYRLVLYDLGNEAGLLRARIEVTDASREDTILFEIPVRDYNLGTNS